MPPRLFGNLNDALSELYLTDLTYYKMPSLNIDQVITLAKRLKKREGIEVIVMDALHRIDIQSSERTSQTERRFISSALKSVAHVGKMIIVGGYSTPDDPFAALVADSVFHCEGWDNGIEEVLPEPRGLRLAVSFVGGKIKHLCRFLFLIAESLVPLVSLAAAGLPQRGWW